MVDVVDFYHGPEPNLRFEEKFSIKFSKRQINGLKQSGKILKCYANALFRSTPVLNPKFWESSHLPPWSSAVQHNH